MLKEAGVTVRVFLVGDRTKMTPDTRVNEERLNSCGVQIEDFDPNSERQRCFTEGADLLIDAIFGIGLHRELRPEAAQAVEWINRAPGIVIAADIPSGVEANTGRILAVPSKRRQPSPLPCPSLDISSGTAVCVRESCGW